VKVKELPTTPNAAAVWRIAMDDKRQRYFIVDLFMCYILRLYNTDHKI